MSKTTINGYEYTQAEMLEFLGITGSPSTSIIGKAKIYFDNSSGKLKVSENGGAYVNLVGGGSGTPGGDPQQLQYNLGGAFAGLAGSDIGQTNYDALFSKLFSTSFSTAATNLTFGDSGADSNYANPTTINYRVYSYIGGSPSSVYLSGTFIATAGGVGGSFTADTNGSVTGYVIGKSTDGGLTWSYSNIQTDLTFNDDNSGGSTGFPNSSLPTNATFTYINYAPGDGNAYGFYTNGSLLVNGTVSLVGGKYLINSTGIGILNSNPQAPVDFNVPNAGDNIPLFFFSNSAGGSADICGLFYNSQSTPDAVYWQLENNAGSGIGMGGFHRPMAFVGGYILIGQNVSLQNNEVCQINGTSWDSGILGLYDVGGNTRASFAQSGAVSLASGSFAIDSSGNLSAVSSTLSSLTASKPVFTDGSKKLISGSFSIPQIVASGDLTAKTVTQSSVTTYTTPNDSTTHSFRVGAYTAITAISAGTLTITVTFTDENNTGRTVTYFPMGLTSAGLTGTGFTAFEPVNIRCKANTAITLVATFAGVSITFDVGGTIESLY